ncbi:NAD-dependent epimerase/dehydratase family protein [Sulfitobacter sp. NFXS29]|uniref:NAD-dependent epimerase/dehydratase family protein n=1 Tax=Sulfitobacter sp. NFXS29 TaxID=2818438 RepID=UPI0032DF81B1
MDSTQRILVTGTGGFIGFHLARLLLAEGARVQGYDGMTDYYDVALKQRRHAMLLQHEHFTTKEALLEDRETFDALADDFQPDMIVHLAAQAGVRHSIDHPRAFLEANITGTFNVMEAARRLEVKHLLMASSSSIYGANTDMPFGETGATDRPLSIYAATKKANEGMAHAYAHLWNLPTTMFRFFTVYGPWGRPDLALSKFVDAILDGRPIDIYNHGEMYRDFTCVDDLARGIRLLMDCVPPQPGSAPPPPEWDSLSPAAPYRVVNIGNSEKVRLLDFVEAIEAALGKRAIRNYMGMQMGDAPATWADATLLHRLTGYRPQTDIHEGIARFVAWFRDYHGK